MTAMHTVLLMTILNPTLAAVYVPTAEPIIYSSS